MMIIPRRKNNYDLFDSMFEDPLFERHEAKFMKTDIKEKGDKYFVDIDLPGYDKENIKIEINDKGVFIDDVKVEGENSLYTFEFENAPIDTPKTGDDSKTTIYAGVLGLSLLTLVGLGVYEYKRKKLVNKK